MRNDQIRNSQSEIRNLEFAIRHVLFLSGGTKLMGSPATSLSELKPARSAEASVHLHRRHEADEYPIYWVRESPLKRALDFVLSSLGLLLSAPLWLLAAIAIKLEDGGPVLYRQQRWGRQQETFLVRKFRTMVSDADRRFGLQPARENDHRITRVGRVLRATGMDELPQLLNIWWGDMSLVGPRALAVGEIVNTGNGHCRYEDVPGFRQRLAVRPGLTSLATIYIPKDADPRRKFRYDLYYIRNQSLWLDVKLIALSLWISVRGKWETRGRKV